MHLLGSLNMSFVCVMTYMKIVNKICLYYEQNKYFSEYMQHHDCILMLTVERTIY